MLDLDIHMMLDWAMSFEWASAALQQTDRRNEEEWLKTRGLRRPTLNVPSVVLSAFDLELYFKTLRKIEVGSYTAAVLS